MTIITTSLYTLAVADVADLVSTPFLIHWLNRQNLRVSFQISQNVLSIRTPAMQPNNNDTYGVFTRSSKRPANFQQMYSKYMC